MVRKHDGMAEYMLTASISCNLYKTEVLLKEDHQFLNDTLLLSSSIPTTKTGNRRHDLIDIRTGCLESAIPEGLVDKSLCFFLLKFFLANECCKVCFLLLINEFAPVLVNLGGSIARVNKVLNEFLFAGELDTGIDRLKIKTKLLIFFAVRCIVFGDEHVYFRLELKKCFTFPA